MPRVKIKKKGQVEFFYDLYHKAELSWATLGEQAKVCSRTILDWRKAKSTISEDAFRIFLKLAKDKIKVPEYKLLPDFWSTVKAGKKGGLIVAKKYGGPGTPMGRRKGGLVSQEKRRLYPKLYPNCNLPKIISEPKNSINLAEFIGIMLGDGGVSSKTQAAITLHKEDSKEYILFVCDLIKNLFSISPVVYYSDHGSHKNVGRITIFSTSFIDFLLAKGLKIGNKVRQQVDVPRWIKVNKNFSKHCLRGLIDTDGCVYLHKHRINGCDCLNIGLNFSNRSTPILKFVYKALKTLNFHPKIFFKGVNLYRESEVYRYAEEVGFSNLYHKHRLKSFLKQKYN
ncbi:LAGLIDADG family homing endonuclease [Patescibacteria group bacterium]|nr:LAGLIDADG family homing endonuclease [Patescibacteria group bacterium]